MFSSSRSLRGTLPPVTRYGFGEATSGAYPLVSGVPPTGVFGGSPTLKARDVSFDTSSKEPHLRLWDSLGVTVFKGYAFIQYGTSTEADLAVSALNGYSWNGSILDVKLAIAGMKSHNVTSTVSTSNGLFLKFCGSVKVSLCSQVFVLAFNEKHEASGFSWVKRGAENFSGSSANAKKNVLMTMGRQQHRTIEIDKLQQ
ncbi:Hnrpc-prov protein [Dirofilaria immitis]|nr:Hnrpc-prov protein [Dirofilaria immitis]